MEALANVTSHNNRAHQIRKFVATPPARATTLRLVTAEDPPQTLGEWDVTQARNNGSLALEISALLEEHTTTIQRHTEAVLGWMVGDSKVVASKRLRARFTPPEDEDEDGLSWEAAGINGSTTGQVIQMQRHIEVREKTGNTLIHGLINTALEMNAQLREQLQDARERNRELEQQLSDLAAAEYQQWRAAVPENDNAGAALDPSAEARTHAMQVITGLAQQFGPTIIQAALVRLTSPKSSIAIAPPSAPPPISPAAPPNLSPTAAPTAGPTVAVTAAPPASTAPPPRAPARAPRPPPQRVPVGRTPVRGRK